MHARTFRLLGSLSLMACVAVAGCSSKATTAAAGGKKTPSKATTGVAPKKPTAKPASKPKAKSAAPATPPSSTPPKKDPIDDTSVLAESGSEVGECAAYGLEDNQGYCLGSGTDYLIGCTGGKVWALDCGSYDDANTLTSCEDDTNAGCYAVTLAGVDPDVTDDTSLGEQVGTCRAPDVQEGRGLCSDDSKDLYVCKGGILYAFACANYADEATCGDAGGFLSCGH